jgi:hypothetical protein
MKTVIVLYMPGHAGNFVARLFSLDHGTMPLIRQQLMHECIDQGTEIPDTLDRFENYRFSTVSDEFGSWQEFHRAYADHKDSVSYRLLNVFCNQKYSRIVFPLHPHEFGNDFLESDDTEFYYVDLDLSHWGTWVETSRQKLCFEDRPNELEEFEEYKHHHNMKPINLSLLLQSQSAFSQEYNRVCQEMGIVPNIAQALALRADWYSSRVARCT